MRLTESDIVEKLNNQKEQFLPLRIKKLNISDSALKEYEADALIEFAVQDGPSFKGIAEFASLSTPKSISTKSRVLREILDRQSEENICGLIVAPYIGEEQSRKLMEQGISSLDLSGNMRIRAGGNIYIERVGRPNQYPDTSPIKKIYQGNSSLVCRALLLRPEGFGSVKEIVNFINERNGKITAGTVSKVLKTLEEELLIRKDEQGIIVKQPKGLLENLFIGYQEYLKRSRNKKKMIYIENIEAVCSLLDQNKKDYVFCGFYAAKLQGMGVTDQVTMYVRSIEDVMDTLRNSKKDLVQYDEEYGNSLFIETQNPCVWFNLKKQGGLAMVDDLELYLELKNDKPRGPKIAEKIKEKILEGFNG